MGTLFVDKLDPQSGTSLEIGSSGDTITIPSGCTITNSGTSNGFSPTGITSNMTSGTGLTLNTNGEVTKPLNPAFRVYQSSDTDYAQNHTMYNQNITEVWDVNSDMGTNGSFTAPVTGKYLFTIGVYDINATESTTYDFMLVTSNRTHRWGNRMKYRNDYTGVTNMKLEGTIIADMDANDTAYVKCGSSVTMTNGGNEEHAYYSGNLLG